MIPRLNKEFPHRKNLPDAYIVILGIQLVYFYSPRAHNLRNDEDKKCMLKYMPYPQSTVLIKINPPNDFSLHTTVKFYDTCRFSVGSLGVFSIIFPITT